LVSAIPQLSTVSCQFGYFLVPFKNQPKIFLELSVSGETKKTCLKGTVARDFLPPFFFMNRPDSKAKNMPTIAEVKLSSCGLKKKL
jgi:hypothetical protein